MPRLKKTSNLSVSPTHVSPPKNSVPSKGDYVEFFYSGQWQYGARICDIKYKEKYKESTASVKYIVDSYSVEVAHRTYRGVHPTLVRFPTRYPTRKAVWVIQKISGYHQGDETYLMPPFDNYYPALPPDVTISWGVAPASFQWTGLWNHSLNKILKMVNSSRDLFLDPSMYRLYNYQTGEIIPFAGLIG